MPPKWYTYIHHMVSTLPGETLYLCSIFIQVITDADGHRTIPSMVAFTDDERELIGRKALCQAEQNPEATIYDAKRFIGKFFTDEGLEKEAARYPFQVNIYQHSIGVGCTRELFLSTRILVISDLR